jgi:hypothetical protein
MMFLFIGLCVFIGGIALFVGVFGLWCGFISLREWFEEYRRNQLRIKNRPRSRFEVDKKL